jgi:hypothetical protein
LSILAENRRGKESCEAYKRVREIFMDTVSYASLNVRENRPRLRKEPDKEVLTECKDELTAVGENTGSTITEAIDSNIPLEITPSMKRKAASLPQVRIEKVIGVWAQIAQGTYDLDERLDIVLDRILKDINT